MRPTTIQVRLLRDSWSRQIVYDNVWHDYTIYFLCTIILLARNDRCSKCMHTQATDNNEGKIQYHCLHT